MSLLSQASLVVTPNAYKEGKLYSVIPSDGSGDMSVTRATTATRVNSAGLVELVPYNLLNYSEQLDNATSWGFGDVVLSSNQIIAPDGTTTADKVTINTVNTEHVVYNTTNYVNEVGNWTTSVYLKKGNCDYVQLANNGANASNYAYIIVNLNNGAVTQSGNSGSYTLNSYAVTSVGNGWYRCSINYNNTSDEARGIRIRFSNSATPTIVTYGSIIFSGNGTDFFYAWGAQFNSGTLKPYQKTETRLNIPRLDYSNGTCPSLLVEPQRTNLHLYSEQMQNTWNYNSPTNTPNTTISPSGIQNADTITQVNVFDHVFVNTGGGDSGTTQTFSAYYKGIAGQTIYMRFIQGGGGTDAVKEITFTGEWQRESITWVRGTSINIYYLVDWRLGGTATSFQAWGAQLEVGSYPTSYIPTTSASVTRNADVISKTGISSLLPQQTGTMFVEFDWQKTFTNTQVISISNNSTNLVWILKENDTTLSATFFMSGYIGTISYTLPSNSQTIKAVYSWTNNDQVLYVNGVQAGTASGAITSSPNNYLLEFNAFWSYLRNGTYIKAAALWKTRLTNDELERLTGTGFNTYAEMANYYNYITQ